jgi:hypothetical protein
VDKGCQKVALVGLGGIGKTQIALRFAYSMKQHCPEFSIFWVSAQRMETFEQGCADIARVLGIRQSQERNEDIRKLVQQRLSTKGAGKWLLIVDNADDLDLLRGTRQREGLLNFLPQSDDGLTIFTTRHHEVAQSVAGSDVVEVEKMGTQEAIDLVRESLIRKSQPDVTLMTDLLTELDYLPLAIIQAAAYINTNKSSVSEYLRLLKDTGQNAVTIMSREFYDNTRYKDSANAIARTWMVTFNQILQHDLVAADLLAFISCIEWKAIPLSILPVVQPEAQMAGAIGTLCSYSFLERREGGRILDMHRLVHLATKIWIAQSGSEAETKTKAVRHLSEVFPSAEYTNREAWHEYLPHVARIGEDEYGAQLEEKSELYLKVGQCLYADGRIREAVLWLQRSCEEREKSLAEDHPSRLASQHELAGAYQANGQVKEAVKLLERVVAISREVLAEDHPDRLASQHELARAYQANGQVKEAVKLLERVVAIKAEVLAEDHPSRLVSEELLTCIYKNMSETVEAEQIPGSSIDNLAAKYEDRSQPNQVVGAPRVVPSSSKAFVMTSGQPPIDHELKPSQPSKKRYFLTRLRDILRKEKERQE